jgi:integrase
MTNSGKTGDPNPYEKIADRVAIFHRGDIWYANFQQDGKQRRISLKTKSKKQARTMAIRLEADLQDGTYKRPKTAPSIKSVTDSYLQYLRTESKAPKTIQKVELVVRRALDLAERRRLHSVADIDLTFVDAYRSERVAAAAKPKTVLNETVIVRQIVNFALSRKLVDEDPLAGLKLKKPKLTEQPCWTRAEVDRILAASDGWHRDALLILAETGMRVGEAKWLTWADVDLERNVLHVRAKPGWRPKTGDQRAIPITPVLRSLLERLNRDSQWVLTAPRSRQFPEGGRQISERRLLQYLKRVVKKQGLVGHLHTFRHAFISNALTSGIPEAVVRSWVGHVDPQIMRLYTHINDVASQAAMARLAAANTDTSKKSSGPCLSLSPRRPGRGSAQIQHTRRRSRNEKGAK